MTYITNSQVEHRAARLLSVAPDNLPQVLTKKTGNRHSLSFLLSGALSLEDVFGPGDNVMDYTHGGAVVLESNSGGYFLSLSMGDSLRLSDPTQGSQATGD